MTKVIGKRGKRVAVNDKENIVTTKSSNKQPKKAKKVISRRGKSAHVLKKVRSI